MKTRTRSLPDTTPLSDSEDESSSQFYLVKKQRQQPVSVSAARSNTPKGETALNSKAIVLNRLLRLSLLLVCSLASFLAGRVAVNITHVSQPLQNATATVERIREKELPSQAEKRPPRLPLANWLEGECESGLEKQTKEALSPALKARIQHFAELTIHPALLATQRPAKSVALVLDGIEDEEDEALFQVLLQQLSLHKSIEQLHLIVEEAADCPDVLATAASDVSFDVSCGTQEQLVARDIDVVFLFDDCNVLEDDDETPTEEEDDDDIAFWKARLSSDIGTLVTCAGETLPIEHPQAFKRFVDDREDMLLDDDDESADSNSTEVEDDVSLHDFAKVIEYDVRLPPLSRSEQSFASTIAVAMVNATSMAHWRLNSAHYERRMHQRMNNVDSLQYMDSATMLTLQYPSKQASIYSCQHYIQAGSDSTDDDEEDEDDLEFARDWCLQDNPSTTGSTGHGYNPFIENVPITDLYMDKSMAGDHAGRGVFTKRDIPAEAYVALETTVHSVLYEWTTTDLHNDMKGFVQEAQKAHIVFVYAEAYGFSQDPWNMPQEAVMTHLLTFVNHGCNGTANLGDLDDTSAKWTEFTVDLESGVVPEDFKTTVDVAYLPAFDRDQAKHETMSRAGRFIKAGEELYDNYMSFGGDQYFVEMVETLRQECSGSLGMVEQYQRKEKVSMVTDVGKKDSVEHGKEERW